MIQLLDRVSAVLGIAAAVAYFVIGLMLGYEVFARYLFTAPTIWAEELSRLLLVWGTFVAAAVLLHRRQHIRITILTERLPYRARQVQEILALLFIGAFAAAVVWYGTPLAFDSFERGRTTGSMLDIPIVWMEAAVPVGCTILLLQALAEAARVLLHGPAPLPDPADVAH